MREGKDPTIEAATSTTPDVSFRYPWHAALVFCVTAGVAVGIALMLPVWILMEQIGPHHWGQMEATSGSSTSAWWGSLVFMIAMATAIAAGILAFVLWRVFLVPGRRFALLPGAMAGVLVSVVVTLVFTFVAEQPLAESWGVQTASDPPSAIFLLLLGLALSIPSGLLGALVGGLLAAAQGRVLREEESEIRRAVDTLA